MRRTTYVVSDRLAVRRVRDEIAQEHLLGHRVLTLAGLTARLAGGFVGSVSAGQVRRALRQPPMARLHDLARIADLPGFAQAASATLSAVWHAGIDVEARAAAPGADVRWSELAALQEHVRAAAPPGALLPPELVAAAMARLHMAPRLLGHVQLELLDEVPPLYRPLLASLADVVSTTWRLPARAQAEWATGTSIRFLETPAAQPELSVESCADPAHEVLVALRWVRRLLVDGVPAEQIAVAAINTGVYDDHMQNLAASSRLPIHFANGISFVSTPAGQFSAAMADALLNGPDQQRVRRLISCAYGAEDPQLGALPPEWCEDLAPDAALGSIGHWPRALGKLREKAPRTAELVLRLVTDLAAGPAHAATVAESWLTGKAQEAWRVALAEGPAEALPNSLQRMRLTDDADPASSVIWAPAASLLAWPRAHVRLLGLSARSWPRRSSDEDPLLPQRLLGSQTLQDRTTARRDTDRFFALVSQTANKVVLSRPRRGSDGRKQSISPLLRDLPADTPTFEHLPREGTEHALTEADRRASNLTELQQDPALRRARQAFRAHYHDASLTPHDGVVRAGHPVVRRALGRRHSATSLRKLLLNPHGFIARYGLGWEEPQPEVDVLDLDAASRGSLIHEVLEASLTAVQHRGGFSDVSPAELERIVAGAVHDIATQWELTRPVPPKVAWQFELRRAADMALEMLSFSSGDADGMRSYAEVKFGYAAHEADPTNGYPWWAGADVKLPGTELRLRGIIDRLDLDPERKLVRVIDYKTGKPRKVGGGLDQGEELQRTLYTVAVKQLLGEEYSVEAGLLFAGATEMVALEDPAASVEQLTSAVREAARLLEEGLVAPGPAITDGYEEAVLAYPAAGPGYYYQVKREALEAPRRTLDMLLRGDLDGEGAQA